MGKNVVAVLGGDVSIPQLKEICCKTEIPVIIAADKGLEALDRAGVMPDIIMGDYDSVEKDVLEKYMDKKPLFFDPVKDFTDGEAAVDKALELSVQESEKPEDRGCIIILGATGNRPDHMLANISLLKKTCDSCISAEIISENSRIRLFKGPDRICFHKEKYDYISLLPLGDSVEEVTIKGFKYDTECIRLVQGSSLGISNELIADDGQVNFSSGYLIVIETSDM